MNANVIKVSLPNGLTVLVHPVHTIPKVAVQLWYGVGSKNEYSGERGLAHLLEHMTFKGTRKLSEPDINLIAHRLSGSCNAFTSHDYTCYVYDLPSQYWTVALDLLADCMINCTFKNELLYSEVRAVIQELKMYKDDYNTALMEELVSAIFSHHPYHYPIIGYKQDLWQITRESLLKFYQKHYLPNNATLVIVGDIDPQQAIAKVESIFGPIAPAWQHHHDNALLAQDLSYKSISLYRDVQQSHYMFAFVGPGLRERQEYLCDIARWIIAEGRGSRLYKKLVEQLRVATDVGLCCYDLTDATVFFIQVTPAKGITVAAIRTLIEQELYNLRTDYITDQELTRAKAQVAMDHVATFDNISKIAYGIGRSYIATGDEFALFKYPAITDQDVLKESIKSFFSRYANPVLLHEGALLPLTEHEQKQWVSMQEKADEDDKKYGELCKRGTELESGSYVHSVTLKDPMPFAFPQAQKSILSNGLAVLWHDSARSEKIEIILSLKAKYYYDTLLYEGIGAFVSEMLVEGTRRWPEESLSDELESRGINLTTQPGYITLSVRPVDLPYALEIINELVAHATFPLQMVEKVREQLFSDLETFWDNPYEFVGLLAKQMVYGEHPYSKSALGSQESLARIMRDDLISYYQKYYTPHGATLVITGKLQGYDIPGLAQQKLGLWQGPLVEDISFPVLTAPVAREMKYPIARDQIVVCFAGLSVNRYSEDFDALLLFDQLFSGGVLGSMSSLLFKLRERTGLFYTIEGSLVANVDEEPGLVFIRTIISPEQLTLAEDLIKKTIEQATNSITENDLLYARNAIMSALIDNFEASASMAEMFLFLDRYKLSADYFDRRLAQLKKIDVERMTKAVERVLNTQRLVTIQCGRLKK